LCGFCPHELFTNTKSDLGICDKVHDEKLQQEYVKSRSYQCLGYEIEFAGRLSRIIRDIDSVIRKRKEKVAHLGNPENTSAAATPLLERIAHFQELINKKSLEAESLGNQGLIDEACELMKEIEKIEEDKRQQEAVIVNLQAESEKKQQICETCGAYLVINEAQHRLDEHLKGKLHSGSLAIREYLKNYEQIENVILDKYDSHFRRRDHKSYSRKRSPQLRKRHESIEAGELRHSSSSLDREQTSKNRSSNISRSGEKFNRSPSTSRKSSKNGINKDRSRSRGSRRRTSRSSQPKSPEKQPYRSHEKHRNSLSPRRHDRSRDNRRASISPQRKSSSRQNDRSKERQRVSTSPKRRQSMDRRHDRKRDSSSHSHYQSSTRYRSRSPRKNDSRYERSERSHSSKYEKDSHSRRSSRERHRERHSDRYEKSSSNRHRHSSRDRNDSSKRESYKSSRKSADWAKEDTVSNGKTSLKFSDSDLWSGKNENLDSKNQPDQHDDAILKENGANEIDSSDIYNIYKKNMSKSSKDDSVSSKKYKPVSDPWADEDRSSPKPLKQLDEGINMMDF